MEPDPNSRGEVAEGRSLGRRKGRPGVGGGGEGERSRERKIEGGMERRRRVVEWGAGAGDARGLGLFVVDISAVGRDWLVARA